MQKNEEDTPLVVGESERSWKTKLGRPQKFDPELAIRIMEEEIDKHIRERNKEGRYFEMLPTNENGGVTLRGKPFMTVGTVALMCGVSTQAFLLNVNDKNEDGSIKNAQLFESYQRFKDLGQIKLIEGGAAGAYSSNYVSFVGNVNYGLIPKNQVEQTVEIKSMDKIYQNLDQIYGKELQRQEEEKQTMVERKAMLDAIGDNE